MAPVVHRILKRPVYALAVCLAFSGCEALSPHQLWKLNRQPNLDRGDAYFSIPAELDAEAEAGDVVSQLEAPDLVETQSPASHSSFKSNPKSH